MFLYLLKSINFQEPADTESTAVDDETCLMGALNLDDNSAVEMETSPLDDSLMNSQEWKRKKHIFIMSSAGKPVYSR